MAEKGGWLTVIRQDPLRDPALLIQRVYAYVAYRIGPGDDAEDLTSQTLERALRYRDGYDARKGSPTAWTIGIARRCVAEWLAGRWEYHELEGDIPSSLDLEHETLDRVMVRTAVAALSDKDQELIALRYGADLTARQIADLLEMRTNAVEVALHRALERLRAQLGDGGGGAPAEVAPVRV